MTRSPLSKIKWKCLTFIHLIKSASRPNITQCNADILTKKDSSKQKIRSFKLRIETQNQSTSIGHYYMFPKFEHCQVGCASTVKDVSDPESIIRKEALRMGSNIQS